MTSGPGAAPMLRADLPRCVLMTADAVGGVWTYALDLIPALRRRGVEVVLATMGPRPHADQHAAARRLDIDLRESDFRLEWMPGAWADVDRAGDWLLELADKVDADLIHLGGYCHATLPFGRPVIVVAHSCVWSWWSAVKGEKPTSDWYEYRERVAAGLAAADRVVAPTRAMLQALEDQYMRLRHGLVIHNGRAPDAARPRAKEPFILAAGRLWDEAKNLAALERVARRVPWPIRVAGDCRHPEGHDVPARDVEVLGRLSASDLAEAMGRAAVFAAPARYEPFGLTAVEAALAGCALVLGDIPSLREVWGARACFVPPDDDDALAQALNRLADDAARRTRLADAARTRALALHPDAMADAYVGVYLEAAADRADTRVMSAVEIRAGSR